MQKQQKQVAIMESMLLHSNEERNMLFNANTIHLQ